MDRSCSGITGRGAEHGNRLPGARDLCLVEVPQELKGEVFEGERGTMKELQHVEVVRELLDGCNLGIVERRI